MKRYGLIILLSSVVLTSMTIKLTGLDIYPMNFEFKNSHNKIQDTVLDRLGYRHWSTSHQYPAYVKWLNEPFAVLKSKINGVGLFSDSATSFSSGQVIGYAFYKVGSTGKFYFDYRESSIGSFVNDASSPNVNVVLTSDGIILKANQSISPNTELTASYQQLIKLFPSDSTVAYYIKYWK